MDTLSRLIALYPVRTALDVRCHFGAPWLLDHPQAEPGVAPYHLITRGTATIDGADGLVVHAGDVIVFPHGASHRLYAGDPARATPPTTSGAGLLRYKGNEGEGAPTDILCGEFRFDVDAAGGGLLAALPDVLVVHTDEGAEARGLRQVMQVLQAEAEAPRDGSDAIVRQLASALFALLIRGWLAQAPGVPGLFAVLAERRLQPALHAMLDAPQQPWTLATLAALCHMSRATFARVFGRAAGAAPAEVLTRLRMARAARWLEAGGHAAGAVAEMVGYQSEAAFHRAFKRQYGVGPGAWRRGGRTTAEFTAPAAYE
ncbi:AraC family transcriptional regulator [Oxalobacteraceae bacterium OTU3CINTB1]|nr:AraC family transcriptional regulator [Oxalobacteraceae bacterium OTU3CINTB1]